MRLASRIERVVEWTRSSPTEDPRLCSRISDGILLVFREGVAPIKVLNIGLNGLDNSKAIS